MGGTLGPSDDREYQRSNKSCAVVSSGGEEINVDLTQRPGAKEKSVKQEKTDPRTRGRRVGEGGRTERRTHLRELVMKSRNEIYK